MATKIYNVYDLQNINNALSGDYELANDIDASATSGWNYDDSLGQYLGFSPIGQYGTLYRFPSSDISSSGSWILYPEDGIFYTKLNSEDWSMTDYVQTSVNGSKFLCGIKTIDYLPPNVSMAITVKVPAKRIGGTASLRASVRLLGTEYWSGWKTVNTSTSAMLCSFTTCPLTGLPWTASDIALIDAIGVEVQLSSSTVRITSCWIEGNYVVKFTGTLDGKGHKITNLYINRPYCTCGLFGYVTGGSIKNIIMQNVNITSGTFSYGYWHWTGALAGRIYTDSGEPVVTVTNCSSSGDVTVGSNGVAGGLIGEACDIEMHNCHSSCTVTGHIVGGLVGSITEYDGYLDIHDCYATGNVTSDYQGGGFAGNTEASTPLYSCYATGSVNGSGALGGFVGIIYRCNISKCFAIGNILGTSLLSGGGFVGALQYSSEYINIEDCYARGSVQLDSPTMEWCELGGFAGSSYFSVEGNRTIRNCYCAGLVNGIGEDVWLGGFWGRNDDIYGYPMTFNACFWDKDISTQSSATGYGPSIGITGKTTAQMKARPTFTNAGWDIAATNTSRNDGYPFLAWELGKSGTWLIYEYTPPPLSPRNQRPVQDKVTLEAIRNIEVTAGGRFFVDREGRAVYRSRYARNK